MDRIEIRIHSVNDCTGICWETEYDGITIKQTNSGVYTVVNDEYIIFTWGPRVKGPQMQVSRLVKLYKAFGGVEVGHKKLNNIFKCCWDAFIQSDRHRLGRLNHMKDRFPEVAVKMVPEYYKVPNGQRF